MRGINIDWPFHERPFVPGLLAKIGPPRTWNVLAGRFAFGLAAYAASASAVIAVVASGSHPMMSRCWVSAMPFSYSYRRPKLSVRLRVARHVSWAKAE